MHKLFLALLLVVASSAPSLLSGATLYANLPNASGWTASNGALTITAGQEVSNSFDLSAASVLQGVEFLSWNSTGDVISSVDWVISDGDAFNGFGTVYGSGSAVVSNSFQFINDIGYDINANTFGLPNVNLDAGTYFLTLRNAVTDVEFSAYWDQNNGPSAVWQSSVGSLAGVSGCLEPCTGSESFSITGSTSTSDVPEPTTWTLFGLGLAALAYRRKSGARA